MFTPLPHTTWRLLSLLQDCLRSTVRSIFFRSIFPRQKMVLQVFFQKNVNTPQKTNMTMEKTTIWRCISYLKSDVSLSFVSFKGCKSVKAFVVLICCHESAIVINNSFWLIQSVQSYLFGIKFYFYRLILSNRFMVLIRLQGDPCPLYQSNLWIHPPSIHEKRQISKARNHRKPPPRLTLFHWRFLP